MTESQPDVIDKYHYIECEFCISTGRHPYSTDREHILYFRKLRRPDKKRRQRRRLSIRKERKEEQRRMNDFFDHYNKKYGFTNKLSCDY